MGSGTILIVDDDPDFGELVSAVCRRGGYTPVEADTREEVLALAKGERPDAVLLDVKLGATSGYQVCRELREEFGEHLPILFVSGARTDASDRVAGLLLGGDDYLTKPIDSDELLARVGRALTRAGSSQNGNGGQAAARLTPRERDVLALLAQGLATAAISDELHLSPKTVGTHVQRILTKLDVHSRAGAVAVAYREGLIGDVSAHGPAVATS